MKSLISKIMKTRGGGGVWAADGASREKILEITEAGIRSSDINTYSGLDNT